MTAGSSSSASTSRSQHSAAAVASSPSASLSGSAAAGVGVLSTVSACLSAWGEFELPARLSEMESVALLMAEEEERSQSARAQLSSLSRQLKRLSAEQRLQQLGQVVRSYQEEINALTRRAKQAETGFLSLYTALMPVPDPAPALAAASASLQQLPSLTLELHRLRQQLREYETEFSSLKNQDATLRRLEAELREADRRAEARQLQSRQQAEEQHRQDVAALRQASADSEAQHQAALAECERRLSAVSSQLLQQEAAHFRATEAADRELKEAEREMEAMRAEQERMQAQLLALQAQLADRRAEEAEASEGAEAGAQALQRRPPRASSFSRLTELEEAVFSLREALTARDAERDDWLDAQRREREDAAHSQREQQRLIQQQQQAIAALQAATQQQQQQRHSSSTAADSELQDGDDAAQRDVLETAAAAAVQAEAEAELRSMRSALSELRSQLADGERREADWLQREEQMRAASQQQLALIAQLEQDILELQQQQASADATDAPSTSAAPAAAAQPPPAAACCSCSSLLSIVTGQRDRLRLRVEVAEKAASEAKAALLEARQQAQQLNADNLELYEKLTFVRSFAAQPPTPAAAPAPAFQPASRAALHPAADHLVSVAAGGERRYASLYAESLNPFAAFRARQLLQSEKSLPPSERVTLQLARALFSRRAARSFAFFYALVLHLLVFAVLVTHTVTDHCQTANA